MEKFPDQIAHIYRGSIADAVLENYRREGRKAITAILAKSEAQEPPEAEKERIIGIAASNVLTGLTNGTLGMESVHLLIKRELRRLLADMGIGRQDVRDMPKPHEQKQRNYDLNEAKFIAKENPDLRKKIVELAGEALKVCFPPDIFNSDGFETLSHQQVNDLTDSFLLWAIQNSFTDQQLLIAYLYLFQGLDSTAVALKIKTFGEEDNRDYGLDVDIKKAAAQIETEYRAMLAIFDKRKNGLMEEFLSRASFSDTGDKALMSPETHKKVLASRERVTTGRYVLSDSRKTGLARSIRKAEVSAVDIAETKYEKCLEGVDIIRAQRGDISARNRIALRMLRFMRKMAYTGYAKYMIKRYGSTSADHDDLESEFYEMMVEKIVGSNPRLGRITTYLSNYSRTTVDDFAFGLVMINNPQHIHRTMNSVRKYSPHSIEELCNIFAFPREVIFACLSQDPTPAEQEIIECNELTAKKIKSIRMMREGLSDQAIANLHGNPLAIVEQIRAGLINGYRHIPVDAPISKDEKDGETLGQRLKQYTCSIDGGLQVDFKRQLIEQAFALLAPRDAQFLREKYLEGKKLEEVGGKRELTRERARQIEEKLIETLRDLAQSSSQKIQCPVTKDIVRGHVVIVQDIGAFETWLNGQTDLHPQAPEWFKIHLGLNYRTGYTRPGNMATLHKIIQNGNGSAPVSLSDLKSIIGSMSQRLKRTSKKLPTEKCFIVGVNKVATAYCAVKLLEKADNLLE